MASILSRPQCVNINTKDCHYANLRCHQWWLGLKRYAQPTIRYDTRYDTHDRICSSIHLPFLPGKLRLVIPACDQKYCTPPTTTACAVMMRSGYNNGGLLEVSRCSVFVMNSLILLEYTDCFLWYLVFVSNFSMCYICTVSYRIILWAYCDTCHSLCIGDIPVCRCIVSALVMTKLTAWQFSFSGCPQDERSREMALKSLSINMTCPFDEVFRILNNPIKVTSPEPHDQITTYNTIWTLWVSLNSLRPNDAYMRW